LDAPAGQIWALTNTTITTGMDQVDDAVKSGINLKLGGWDIYCVTGWSDHEAALNIIINSWAALGINLEFGTESYGDFISKRDARDFQLYYSSLGNALANTPLNVMQYFTGNEPQNNVTQWVNQQFADAFAVFSTATSDATKTAAMNTMQNIIGQIMPSIPVAVNCYWYTYNEQYWLGFPNARGVANGYYNGTGQYASRSDYSPPVTHWTNNHYGLQLLILNNLKSTGYVEPGVSVITIVTTDISGNTITTVSTVTTSPGFESLVILLGVFTLGTTILMLRRVRKH
jgi:ABC-type transport system substrate-binding protein